MRRKLTLSKETLTELTTADLSGVVGGASHNTLCVECANDISFEKCPTLPLEECPITLTTVQTTA